MEVKSWLGSPLATWLRKEVLGYVVERHTYKGTVTYTCSLRRFTANTAKPLEGAGLVVCPFNFKSQDEDTSLKTNRYFTKLGIRRALSAMFEHKSQLEMLPTYNCQTVNELVKFNTQI